MDAKRRKDASFSSAPSPSVQVDNKFEGVTTQGHSQSEEGTPLDPAIEPNKFPRQHGSDTYDGIPGDGKVPG